MRTNTMPECRFMIDIGIVRMRRAMSDVPVRRWISISSYHMEEK